MAGVSSCWVGLVVLVAALAAPVMATIPPECNTTGTPNVDLRLERCAFHDINAEVRMFNMGIVHVSPGCFAGNQIGRLYMPVRCGWHARRSGSDLHTSCTDCRK